VTERLCVDSGYMRPPDTNASVTGVVSAGRSGGPARSSCPPGCSRQCDEPAPWKRTAVLDVSVDVRSRPTTIVLRGMLEGNGGNSLVPVVAELIGAGHHAFELKTDALCVPDDDGVHTLACLERYVRRASCTLEWTRSTANRQLSPG
jgi:hypothetical protein